MRPMIVLAAAMSLTLSSTFAADAPPAKDTLSARARAVCDSLDQRQRAGQALTMEFVDQVAQWSRRCAQAEHDEAGHDAAARQKAWQGHLDRMNELAKVLKARERVDVALPQVRMGQYYVKEAEQLAAAARPAAADAIRATTDDVVASLR